MNEQTMNKIEEPITIGCPSLGLPNLPSGADGVEPMARMDYEKIITDLFHKCNEAFINAPNQRDTRPGYFKIVVGDISEALASVVPVELARGTRAPTDVYKTPDAAMDVVIDNLTPEMIEKICARHGLKKRMTREEYLTVFPGVELKRFNGTKAIRLVAVRKGKEGNADNLFEISIDKDGAIAVIERDGEILYQIKTIGLSYKRVQNAAINVLRSHLHENKRVYVNHREARIRRAEERVAKEIKRELDATIARQMGDDDLAEQIENS